MRGRTRAPGRVPSSSLAVRRSRAPASRQSAGGYARRARMNDPETVARNFFAAWPQRNMEELLGYFTDDALYHNMPLEPVTGKDGIREVLNMFIFSEGLEAEVIHVATWGDVVFTERVDRMTLA